MNIHRDTNGHMVILRRGEELLTALERYAANDNLAGAALQAGVGGAESVTLSFYDLQRRQYVDTIFDEPLEILSLQGNLTRVDGRPFWHIHGTFGTRDYKAIGGHVKTMKVALTAELLIEPLATAASRAFDEETGLRLITPSRTDDEALDL